MTPRYLTKSRYVLGLECPTKLFYTGKRDEYVDQTFDDLFLQQLANGGFQVGELAKCYYPDGIEVTEKGYDESVARTYELLASDNVTIFEAAIEHKNLFIRIDILVKRGNHIDLIEVKAKSWPPSKAAGLIGAKGGLNADFKPKIAELAFQKYVVSGAFPDWEITPYFLFSDKTARCPSDGLNQKFRIQKENGRRRCVVSGEITGEDKDPWIVTLVPAEEACKVFQSELDPQDSVRSFEDHIDFLATHYDEDRKVTPRISGSCAKCEFKTKPEDLLAGKKSGKHECWREALGWTDEAIDRQNVLNIWDFRKKDAMIAAGKIKLEDISEADIGLKNPDGPGISRTHRQWMQVTKARDGNTEQWFDKDGLRAEMETWNYPLHFIDFETSMPAIPFKRGRRPYEGIAFQFSHHIVHDNGVVQHHGEFLSARPGEFPNYDFIRALRDELYNDEGSIFRYSPHENTYLNMIWEQLRSDDTAKDRDELCAFIQSITQSKKDQVESWKGSRNMIDLLDLVKRFYYHPATQGSNSIKYVLPAILSSSDYLKEKYSAPYTSKNFPNGMIWVQPDGKGGLIDPYKLLEPMFADATPNDLELLLTEEEDTGGIREGGAAMAAYMILQCEEMSDYERKGIEKALLQYCELDTLAMVMIYEAWREFSA